jgi:hypothetical protein
MTIVTPELRKAMTAVELLHHTFPWEIAPGVPWEPGQTRPDARHRDGGAAA